jgi:hypothetical protein
VGTAKKNQNNAPWEEPVYELPEHARLRYELRGCFEGRSNLIVLGPKGVGKTFIVKKILAEINDARGDALVEAMGADGSIPTTQVPKAEYYMMGEATGRKTALVVLARHFLKLETSPLNRKDVNEILDLLADHFTAEGIRLLVVDEFEHMDSNNLDQVRQLIDVTRDREHPFGLCLVGTPEARDDLRKTGEIGQRYTDVVEIPKMGTLEVEEALPDLHPDLKKLMEDLPAKEWRRLSNSAAIRTNGLLRRLYALVRKADRLARHNGRDIDAEIFATAIRHLAPDD